MPVNVPPPIGAAEKLYPALCPAATVTVLPPVSLHATSVPTTKLTDCECVSVPSVPWTLKLNVPVVALPTVTVNAAPPAVGTSIEGFTEHVPGAAPEQLSVTLAPYPFTEVSVPLHTTLCPATVEPGVAVTASAKFAIAAVTVTVKV